MGLSDELGKGKEAIDAAARSINDLGTESTKTFTNITNSLGKLASEASKMGQGGKDLTDSFKGSAKLAHELVKSTGELVKFDGKMLKDKKALKKLATEEMKVRKSLTAIASEQRNIAIELKQAEIDGNSELQKALLSRSKLLSDAQDNAEEVLGTYSEIAKVNEKISKETKWADTLGDALGSIPGIGPMISGPFKAASKATRDARAEGEKWSKAMLKGGVELISWTAIFTALIGSMFKTNTAVNDMAKGLQISRDEASEINGHFNEISNQSGKAYLNTNNLREAQMQLTNELGMAVQFSDDQVKNQTFLTKQLKLSEKSAAKFTKYQISTGKSAEETNKEIADSVANLQKETGIAFKLNDVFEDVANVNAGLKAAYGFNNKLLAEQVVQTKKIGINLEQAEKIASSMLDFESSIQAELEAELLTGKALNFEEAKRLALMGKSTEAAAEILDQVGSTEDLMKMNVIQQEALAKAVGMERNELIASVKQREVQEKLGGKSLAQLKEEGKTREEIAAITGESLLKQMEQEAAAEQFQSAVVKIQETLGQMMDGPFGDLVNGLATAVSSAGALYGIMGGLAALGLARLLGSLASMAISLGASSAAALTTASAITFGVGIVAILGAVAYGLATMNSEADKTAAKMGKMKDGEIDFSKGPVVQGEFGSVQLDKSDTGFFDNEKIKAGTDLMGVNKGGGNNSDNSQLIAKIDQLIKINTRIAQVAGNRKQDKITLEIMGDKVGNDTEMQSRSIQ